MSTKKSVGERHIDLAKELREAAPTFTKLLEDFDEFRRVSFKAKPDGSMLVVISSFDGDGSPVVAFGVGYGFAAAILAIDATMQGGNWKVDKYWQGG